MTRLLSYIVQPHDADMRLDALLAARGLYASRSAAASKIENHAVCVNGNPTAKKYAVKAGDTIVYQVEDPSVASPLTGQSIALDIRFEDDELIVLSKQAGLVCHPSVDHADNTLVNALVFHCGAEHLCNVQGADDRLGIVHRLDRDTTGLMLAAKSDETGYALMADIRDRMVDRHYLALVHGIIVRDSGMIETPLARSQDDRCRMAVRDVPSAREALTTFRVLERFCARDKDNGYTLIDCKLFTGRTHQIRVHMEYTKHPLVGDPVYSGGAPKDKASNLGLQRQFLHSFRLGFTHPKTGEELHFISKLPNDLQDVLDMLAHRSTGRTAFGNEIFAQLSQM